VGELQLAALGAFAEAGGRQLPNVGAALVLAGLGAFSLGYCHFQHLLFWDGTGTLRTCIHNRLTPSGRIFFRPAALKILVIHQVFLRIFALQDEKISRPAGIIRL
jgi:hypothetical protein